MAAYGSPGRALAPPVFVPASPCRLPSATPRAPTLPAPPSPCLPPAPRALASLLPPVALDAESSTAPPRALQPSTAAGPASSRHAHRRRALAAAKPRACVREPWRVRPAPPPSHGPRPLRPSAAPAVPRDQPAPCCCTCSATTAPVPRIADAPPPPATTARRCPLLYGAPTSFPRPAPTRPPPYPLAAGHLPTAPPRCSGRRPRGPLPPALAPAPSLVAWAGYGLWHGRHTRAPFSPRPLLAMGH
nr:vegetative cell wall protein gp1-like [Aegilops tauschii subsp. strangulata]